jgi:glycosyltransferase involved in cell wall biosynthesis
MNNPLISCIVPVYNGARFLREALDSIMAQTYRPVEIIVVDDGSTDDSAKIAQQYPAPIRLHSQANAGPAAARNRGVGLACGEFLAFLDADDLWHPEKLEGQMARLRQRPELAFCVTHIQNFWIPELRAEKDQFEGSRLAEPLPGYNAPTLLVRSTAFRLVGEFCESMPHTSEPDWFLRAAEVGALGELLPDILVRRRLHHANRSRLRSSSSRDEYLRFIKARLDRKRQEQHGASGP